jgi:hypothetical protein
MLHATAIQIARLRRFPIAFMILFLAVAGTHPRQAAADASDLVPQGSVLLDAFARMADGGYLGPGYAARDFYTAPRYAMEDLAQILDSDCLQDDERLTNLEDSAAAPALVAAVTALQPELKADGVDTDEILGDARKRTSEAGGYVQPEYRAVSGNPVLSDPRSVVVYRATAIGGIGTNSGYALSLSNWPQDYRRFMVNGVGPVNFNPLNEAYLDWRGRNGLTFDLGRLNDQWGQGYLGAMLLSDNSPALDQARIQFPFSLGRRLGREYTLTQMASGFREDGVTKIFIARRIEYRFSGQLNADFQEAVKSNSDGTLLLTPLPFETKSSNFSKLLPGVHVESNDPESNYLVNFGLTYTPLSAARLYGQFMIDDLKSPFSPASRIDQRKIGYLAGTTLHPGSSTTLVFEYAYTDPTVYTYRTLVAQWQQGMNDEIGLPSGPNSRDLYARIDQRLNNRITLTADATKRDRKSDSFPEPTYRSVEAGANYLLTKQAWVGVDYQNFSEDPFPYAPGSADYPVLTATTVDPSEANPGLRIRMQEWDATFGISF